MRKVILFGMLAVMTLGLNAEPKKKEVKDDGYKFTIVKENPITSIKNQNRAGTCWCYSGMALLESELLRMGKGDIDLSEMYTVYTTYIDRADKAVRTHGDVSFSQGGATEDVLYGMKHYGLVPEEVMRPGVMYGDTLSDHGELSALTEAMVAAIAKGKLKKLQTDKDGNLLYKKAVAEVHKIYLGEAPDTFTYNGVEYTPQTFYEYTGLDNEEYVSLTSFTHHPFYKPFVIEIEDNWRWSESYNLPIDELMEVFDYAIDNGYTMAWGSDVSEKGFNRHGLGVLPDVEAAREIGSDMAHWLKMSATEKNEAMDKFYTTPQPQKICTQEERQLGFDNFETTDDHGMLIYGKAVDQLGNEFYMVKNSWGEAGTYKGIWYVSKAFARYKTMNITLNKKAIPAGIRAKLGI